LVSGDEVFVQLEPDAVARVDVGAVYPSVVAASSAGERGGEAGVVAAEPHDDVREPVDEPSQWSAWQIEASRPPGAYFSE
jgi:hypothetical protein